MRHCAAKESRPVVIAETSKSIGFHDQFADDSLIFGQRVTKFADRTFGHSVCPFDSYLPRQSVRQFINTIPDYFDKGTPACRWRRITIYCMDTT